VVINPGFGTGCSSTIAVAMAALDPRATTLVLSHPFAFGHQVFPELRSLHGDKAVWRMLDERADEVEEVPVAGPVPLDVDTWADYEAVVAASGRSTA
jgi:molybdenum cofactor cytidylyltransferase